MERLRPTQVKSPEEFLIGKTVVATGKTEGSIEHEDLISFVFSDNTFVILRYTQANGLIFSNADDIVADVEKWCELLIAFHKNLHEQNKASKPEENPQPREMVKTGIVHPFEKLRYAKRIFQLKLIDEKEVEKYEIEARVCELKSKIHEFETQYQPDYLKNKSELDSLLSKQQNG